MIKNTIEASFDNSVTELSFNFDDNNSNINKQKNEQQKQLRTNMYLNVPDKYKFTHDTLENKSIKLRNVSELANSLKEQNANVSDKLKNLRDNYENKIIPELKGQVSNISVKLSTKENRLSEAVTSTHNL